MKNVDLEYIVTALLIATVISILIVMTRSCHIAETKSKERRLTECFKSGKPPLECKEAVK